MRGLSFVTRKIFRFVGMIINKTEVTTRMSGQAKATYMTFDGLHIHRARFLSYIHCRDDLEPLLWYRLDGRKYRIQ